MESTLQCAQVAHKLYKILHKSQLYFSALFIARKWKCFLLFIRAHKIFQPHFPSKLEEFPTHNTTAPAAENIKKGVFFLVELAIYLGTRYWV